ncbi:SIMPL domain-containing protein [uncultured Pelagimonas sp.]|uniref:SIMPL domain-containing protein n=1 Tax=uncultured Pelagimonas sp. TaxID=1618102 RepID=UPI002608EFCF|nr:SIMPL domain-containing protein [uncultured Pelagimonas sp.]
MRVLSFAIALLLTSPVLAETVPTITVSGEASVVTAPDIATLSLGATGRGKDPITAMNATSEILDAVIARLRDQGLEERDIQTSSLRLNRMARWDREKEVEVFQGFEATNMLSIRVRDLSQLSEVLGAVLQDGANSLSNLFWGVQDAQKLEDEARRRAVKDAMAKAALYADAAGVTVGVVQSIRDTAEPMVQSSMARSAPVMEAMAADVPVAAGEIEATARVTMVFEIAQ